MSKTLSALTVLLLSKWCIRKNLIFNQKGILNCDFGLVKMWNCFSFINWQRHVERQYVFSPIVVCRTVRSPTGPSPTIYSFPEQSIDIYIYPYLQLTRPVSALFEWFIVELISLWTGRGMCISLYRSGNMPISMLWSVLVSSRGTDCRTNDDRGKDVVPCAAYTALPHHFWLN